MKSFKQHLNEISSKYNQTGFILPNGTIQKIPEAGHEAFARKIGYEDARAAILKEPYIRFHWAWNQGIESEFNFEFNPKLPGVINRVIQFLKKEYFDTDDMQWFSFELMTSERSRQSTSNSFTFKTYQKAMQFLNQLKSKY